MLPKSRRLTKKRDYTKLAVQGRSVFGPYMTLRVNARKEATRIGFITSTKVMKKAVDRNRAKRRMREAIRALLPEIPPSFSLLFILKPETKDVPFETLLVEVRRLLSKIPEAMTRPAHVSSRGKKVIQKRATPKSLPGKGQPTPSLRANNQNAKQS